MSLTGSSNQGIVKMVFGLFLAAVLITLGGYRASALSLDLQVPVVQPVVNAVTAPVNALLAPVTIPAPSATTVTVPATPVTSPVTTTVTTPAPTTSSSSSGSSLSAPASSSSSSSGSSSASSGGSSSSPTTTRASTNSSSPAARSAAITAIGAQPLSLPFTPDQDGILSRNLDSIGLFGPTTGAYGEQAPAGIIQQSGQGWIIFGVAWYWYVLAAIIAWFVIREGRKVLARRERRLSFRNF